MFEAWHKKSKKGYHATDVWDKFDDPHKEEWYCCPERHTKVTPKEGHHRNITGHRKAFVTSHFMTIDEDRCPTKESDIHLKYKLLIGNLIENKELQLLVYGRKILIKTLDIEKVERPEFRWEQRSEGNAKNKKFRRADVRLRFKIQHESLGKGIVFEIQQSKMTEEEKQEREEDWILEGYSITWIYPDKVDERSLGEINIDKVWATEKLLFKLFPVSQEINGLKKKVGIIKESLEEGTKINTERIKKFMDIEKILNGDPNNDLNKIINELEILKDSKLKIEIEMKKELEQNLNEILEKRYREMVSLINIKIEQAMKNLIGDKSILIIGKSDVETWLHLMNKLTMTNKEIGKQIENKLKEKIWSDDIGNRIKNELKEEFWPRIRDYIDERIINSYDNK